MNDMQLEKIIDLLYGANGEHSYSRSCVNGWYDVPYNILFISVKHFLETGEDVLEEYDHFQRIDSCVTSYLSAYGEYEILSEESIEVFDKALREETFWNLESLELDHPIEQIKIYIDRCKSIYLAHQLKEQNQITYTNRRKQASKAISRKDLRVKLLEQYAYSCVSCKSTMNLSVDHIIPVSLGGGDEMSNLQILCRSCNSKKGNKLPQ